MVCLLSLIIPYIATNSYKNIIKFDKKNKTSWAFQRFGVSNYRAMQNT